MNTAVCKPSPALEGLPPRAAVYAIFLCILFGANAVAIKMSLAGLGGFTAAGIRFSIAAVVIFCWAWLTGKPLALTLRQWWQLVPLGFIFFFQLSLFYFGQDKTTASHGTLIINALPFVVMVLAHFFIAGETVTAKNIVGLVLGFAGVFVLLTDSLRLSSTALLGDATILLAVFVWGTNAVYSKRIIESFHPVQITVYPMVMAVPFFVIAGLLCDDPPISRIDRSIVVAMFYQTFITASFGMVAWSSMIKKYGATVLHSFVFIMPISGVSCGVLLLDEPLTVNLGAAIVLVSVGLVIVNSRSMRFLAKTAVPRQHGPGL